MAVASHGNPTWTGGIRGTVPEAEIIWAAAFVLCTPPSCLTIHVEEPDFAVTHAKAPLVHLMLPKEHAISWCLMKVGG